MPPTSLLHSDYEIRPSQQPSHRTYYDTAPTKEILKKITNGKINSSHNLPLKTNFVYDLDSWLTR